MPPTARASTGDAGRTASPGSTAAGAADTPTPSAGDRYCPTCGRVFDADHRFCPQDGSTLLPRGAGADLVGRVLGGRYQALRKIGEGGMGQVYLARHLRIDRLCAVKVLHAHLTRDPESVGRFSREATTAARIRHPNVVEIHDCGEGDDGLVYIAMEWVEGKPLAQLLRDEGALAPERATRLARQIAGALGAAHQAAIVHRDLKPDNILVAGPGTPEEAAKVVDFGIAKAVQGVTEALTRTGFVVGTPRYMSPEQLMAEPLDPRSDLYSLGCILFEMLTGQEAWGGSDALITRRLTDAPPSTRQRNPAVPLALDRIVLRLLARSAEQRFQTAEELDAALAAIEGAAGARPAKRAWLPWRRSSSATAEGAAEAGTVVTPAPSAPPPPPGAVGPAGAATPGSAEAPAPPATSGPPAASGPSPERVAAEAPATAVEAAPAIRTEPAEHPAPPPVASPAPATPPRPATRRALVAGVVALVVLGGGAVAWWASARDRSAAAAAGEETLASGATAPLASAAGVTDRAPARATGVGTGAHPAAGDVPSVGSPSGAASSGGRPADSAPPPSPGPDPTPQPTPSPRAAAHSGTPAGTMPSAAQRARATPEPPPERMAPRTLAAGTTPSGAGTSRLAAGTGRAAPSTMPAVPYRDTSPGPVPAAPSPQRAAAATEPAERAAPPPAATVVPGAPSGAPASASLKLACSRRVPDSRGTRSAVGTVTCRWTVPANGTTFRVERRAGGADAWEPVSTGRLSSHAGFTADFDQKVSASGSYLYRVQPCTKAGCSAPEVAAIPEPPEPLSAAPAGAPSSDNRITLRGTFNPRDAATVDWELSVHPTGVLLDAPRRCSGKWTRLRPEETVTVSCTPWDVVLPGHKYEAVLRVTSAGGSATSPAMPFETPR